MTDSLTCLVVDDEIAFLKSIKSIIELSPDAHLEIVGEARSVAEAVEKAEALEPDLIFLDIKLPDGTGFDVLKQVRSADYQVIFITAYDQYALNAFKYSTVDYLLKPVSSKDFWAAVSKAKDQRLRKDQDLQIGILADNLKELHVERKKMVLREGENLHIIHIMDILWCEAKGSYTEFNIESEGKILVSHHLKDYEDPLVNAGFVRTHRSFLVNISKVKRFDRSEGGSLYLVDGSQIPVSFRKKDQILKILESI